ncbi:MAG: hypothetical protein KGL31_09675 [candidate division NC10 bacterium]|nr:hypothetical protein [candidate division NC10 bacterium]MDE2322165.1 hypothetical protein [candidate division NC10 bacterium]
MKQIIAIGSIGLLLLAGCATPMTPRESGTLTGAGVGAAAGAVLGGIAGSPGKGAAIGAGVGALTGLLTGNAIQNEQAAQAARPYPPRYAYAPPPPAYQAPYPPPPPPTASLQIEAAPPDTEIIVDGRRIGYAGKFHGSVTVPVVAGPHVIQLYWRGFSITNHIVASPQTTIIVRRDLARSAGAPPPPPGAYSQPPY